MTTRNWRSADNQSSRAWPSSHPRAQYSSNARRATSSGSSRYHGHVTIVRRHGHVISASSFWWWHVRPPGYAGSPQTERRRIDTARPTGRGYRVEAVENCRLPDTLTLQTEPVEMSSHRRVALARRLFQALPIQDPDPPMRVLDQPRFLQDPRDNRHGRPCRPQHAVEYGTRRRAADTPRTPSLPAFGSMYKTGGCLLLTCCETIYVIRVPIERRASSHLYGLESLYSAPWRRSRTRS